MATVWGVLLTANFAALVAGLAALIVAALSYGLRRVAPAEAARLALIGLALVLGGGLAFAVFLTSGFYCMAGCG